MTDQRCSSLCRLQHIHTLPVSQPSSLASLAITPPVSSSPLISTTYRQFILKTVPPTPFIIGPIFITKPISQDSYGLSHPNHQKFNSSTSGDPIDHIPEKAQKMGWNLAPSAAYWAPGFTLNMDENTQTKATKWKRQFAFFWGVFSAVIS